MRSTVVQSITSSAIKPSWVSVYVRSILNNSARDRWMVKRNSCGDALLNQSMFDRGSKQKTSTSLEAPSSTLFRKQGISKGNGCLRCAAMKGGSLHAPPVDIGLLYLGMHALDAAALLGLLSTSICSISICSILASAVRSRICHGSLSCKCAIVRFWPLFRCYCTISCIAQDPASLTQLVRSLRVLSHHLK